MERWIFLPTKKATTNGTSHGKFHPDKPMPGKRIIEFYQRGSRYRIEINESQRFTYGPIAPGSARHAEFGLRIYEGANKENQLAVFPDVTEVRDISLPMIKVDLPDGIESWDVFARREREITYAAFDVIAAYNTPEGQQNLGPSVDKLAKLISNGEAPKIEDDEIPFPPIPIPKISLGKVTIK